MFEAEPPVTGETLP